MNPPGEVWDSLSPRMVSRLIDMTSEVGNMSWEGARRLLIEQWEERANECAEEGLSSAMLWARLVRICLNLPSREPTPEEIVNG